MNKPTTTGDSKMSKQSTMEEMAADSSTKGVGMDHLESFKAGVLMAHDSNGISTEYASLFWGNVFGDEFESAEEAFENGVEAVEDTIERI
jgi:hypothetical protein